VIIYLYIYYLQQHKKTWQFFILEIKDKIEQIKVEVNYDLCTFLIELEIKKTIPSLLKIKCK